MNRKVLIGFKLGDLWTDTFTYSKGEKSGQTGISLKARLLFISWIKIDGEMVHQAPRRDEEQQAAAQNSPVQQAPVAVDSVGYVGGSAGIC